MKLSDNFTLEEFTYSDTAKVKKIDNIPGDNEVKSLKNLVVKLLQPLRVKYGKPMTVNSGYRCPNLNKAVGGVATSQHVKGEAADIKCSDPYALEKVLKESGLDFDQCIVYPTKKFVHLSLKLEGVNRKQHLIGK